MIWPMPRAAALLLLLAAPQPAAATGTCAAPAELVRLQSQLPRTALRVTQQKLLYAGSTEKQKRGRDGQGANPGGLPVAIGPEPA